LNGEAKPEALNGEAFEPLNERTKGLRDSGTQGLRDGETERRGDKQLTMNNLQLTIFLGVSVEPSLLELCRATTENAAKLNEHVELLNGT